MADRSEFIANAFFVDAAASAERARWAQVLGSGRASHSEVVVSPGANSVPSVPPFGNDGRGVRFFLRWFLR